MSSILWSDGIGYLEMLHLRSCSPLHIVFFIFFINLESALGFYDNHDLDQGVFGCYEYMKPDLTPQAQQSNFGTFASNHICEPQKTHNPILLDHFQPSSTNFGELSQHDGFAGGYSIHNPIQGLGTSQQRSQQEGLFTDTDGSMHLESSSPYQNHPDRSRMRGYMNDGVDFWSPTLFGDYDFPEHGELSTFNTLPKEEFIHDLYWKDTETDSQIPYPQLGDSMGDHQPPTSCNHEHMLNRLEEEQYHKGSAGMDGLRWYNQNVEDFLVDDHELSQLESKYIHSTGEGNEINWNNKTPRSGDIGSHSQTDISRNPDVSDHDFPSMPNLDVLLGSQQPKYSNTDYWDPGNIKVFQDHKHEGHSFKPENHWAVRYPMNIEHSSDRPTSNLNGMNRESHPGVSNPFEILKTAHLKNNEAFRSTGESSDLGSSTNTNNHIDNPMDLVAPDGNNLIGSQKPPQDTGEENINLLEDDINVHTHSNVPGSGNKHSAPDFVQNRSESEPFENPEILEACDNEWKNGNLKRPGHPFDSQVRSKRDQEILLKNKESWKEYLEFGDVGELNEGDREIREGNTSVTNSIPQPHLIPSEGLEKSSASVSSHHPEDSYASGEYGSNPDNTQEVKDVDQEIKKTSRQAQIQSNKNVGIYRKQVRSSFDLSIEKYVTPFMAKLEGVFKHKIDLERINARTKKILKERLTFLSHEFLLLLIKVALTYDPDGGDLNATLVEGYRWLKNLWKNLSIEGLAFSYHAKLKAKKINLNPKITSPEEFMISMIDKHHLFNRNQIQPIGYVILNWIEKFKSRWHDTFLDRVEGRFLKRTCYMPNSGEVQWFLEPIETKVRELEAKPHSY